MDSHTCTYPWARFLIGSVSLKIGVREGISSIKITTMFPAAQHQPHCLLSTSSSEVLTSLSHFVHIPHSYAPLILFGIYGGKTPFNENSHWTSVINSFPKFMLGRIAVICRFLEIFLHKYSGRMRAILLHSFKRFATKKWTHLPQTGASELLRMSPDTSSNVVLQTTLASSWYYSWAFVLRCAA